MNKPKLPYQITVRWSELDESYEATVPALRTCIAYGDTPMDAVREVEVAATLWLETAEAEGSPIPVPDISREQIAAIAPLLNVSALAREAKMPVQTLSSKLKRGTALSEDESGRVAKVLKSYGFELSFGPFSARKKDVERPKYRHVPDSGTTHTHERKNYYFKHDSRDDQWKLSQQGSTRAIRSFKTKAEGVKASAQIVGNHGGALHIAKKSGVFQEERTYPRSAGSRRSRG